MKTCPGNGTFDASNFGLACLQAVRPSSTFEYYIKPHLGWYKNDSEGISSDIQSEDCLTINVFRPSGLSNNASLPVLFWTYVFVHFPTHIVASRSVLRHGGGFIARSALLYNGSGIVAHSVARVRFHVFFARSRIQMRIFSGNSSYLCQLQLSPRASWIPTRQRR